MFWSRSRSQERRAEPRLSVNEIVRIEHHGHEKGLGCLRDVSPSGAYLATAHRLPKGDRVRLRLTSLDSKVDDTLFVEARVLRRRRGGVGIQWTEHSPNSVLELMEWQQNVIPEARPPGAP